MLDFLFDEPNRSEGPPDMGREPRGESLHKGLPRLILPVLVLVLVSVLVLVLVLLFVLRSASTRTAG